jgi:GTP-binding protein
VLDEVFDLFVSLEANDEQLDFPVLRIGPQRLRRLRPKRAKARWNPVFKLIVDHVPPPALDVDAPFTFLATLLDRDNFLGRVLTGRVQSGSIKVNDPIRALDADGNVIETAAPPS